MNMKCDDSLSNSLFRVSHDPNSKDSFRNECYLSSKAIFENKVEQLDLLETFPQCEDEILMKVESLPTEENFIFDRPDSWTNVTKNRVLEIYRYWRHNNPTPVNFRKLALHVDLWLSLETFLKSDSQYFFSLEDDVRVSENFLSEALQAIETLNHEIKTWDFFNFVVPEFSHRYFHPWQRLKDSRYSYGYQPWPAACILFTRSGATKLLDFSLTKLVKCDALNANRNYDTIMHDVTYYLGDSGTLKYTLPSWNERYFSRFTFIPEYTAPALWRDGQSTWA